MARCMLKQKSLPTSLWGQVVTTVIYILNRFPTKNIKKKVPKEVWNGKKPSVSHLKVFHFIRYKHVPDARRIKLDEKSEHMIPVGYHNTIAYMLFNQMNNNIMMSRDIVIDQNSSWDWNLGDATNKPLMGYEVDEESSEHEENPVDNVPITVKLEAENQEGVASTSQRPQRTRVLPARL